MLTAPTMLLVHGTYIHVGMVVIQAIWSTTNYIKRDKLIVSAVLSVLYWHQSDRYSIVKAGENIGLL
jgi:hypothetical protein